MQAHDYTKQNQIREKNLRPTVGNAFDFYKIWISNTKEFRISFYVFRIPPFHQCQAINCSLLFISQSFQRILALFTKGTWISNL